MDLILVRKQKQFSGIFGSLFDDEHEVLLFETLEHAYSLNNGYFMPKLPYGSFRCVRGLHHLGVRQIPLETFEIIGVPGHSGILIHPGNTNNDSEGCVLLGLARKGDTILHSQAAFHAFMELQKDCDTFELLIK